MESAFDYIIIGAGSAGCVLASRLSDDPSVRVLLLEAGPAPRTPWIRIPAGTAQLIFPGKYNWGYSTEPEPNLDGRSVYVPRGRTLGGSSAINGMAYVRGHPQDYDQWRQLGNADLGWSLGGWRASLGAVRYGKQDDVAQNEEPSDGYTLVDAHVAYRWDRPASSWEVFLDGSNLTDEEARPHTSLLRDYAPLPGRGVAFGIRAYF